MFTVIAYFGFLVAAFAFALAAFFGLRAVKLL